MLKCLEYTKEKKAEERDIGDIVEDNLKTSGQCGEAAYCANTIKVHITCAFAAPYYVFDKGVLNEVQKRLSKWCQGSTYKERLARLN